MSFGPLTMPDEESIMLVSSTKPGQVASDGLPGEHSPFARALFQWLEKAPEIHFTSSAAARRQDRDGDHQQRHPHAGAGDPAAGRRPGCLPQGLSLRQRLGRHVARPGRWKGLKAQLARDQDVTAAGLGVLAEAERRKGRPLTDEERKRTLEKLKVAARDLVEENDPAAEAALRK